VFRATVLTVVLLFAAGPSAPLICKAWCDPLAAAGNGCHHMDNGGIASVRAVDSCDDSVQGLAGLRKEDLRRAPTSDGGAVVSAARFQIVPAATRVVPSWSRGRPPSDLNQPGTTPLRI
jgi:hypothetical protein